MHSLNVTADSFLVTHTYHDIVTAGKMNEGGAVELRSALVPIKTGDAFGFES